MCPRWTSIPVGSMPYLTRRGRFSRTDRSSFLRNSAFGNDLVDSAFQDRKLFGNVPHRAIKLHGDRQLSSIRDVGPVRPGRRVGRLPILELQGVSTRWPVDDVARVRIYVELPEISLGMFQDARKPCPIWNPSKS